jgi:hypothetical protein
MFLFLIYDRLRLTFNTQIYVRFLCQRHLYLRTISLFQILKSIRVLPKIRKELTPPGTNGRQCPHLSETQNCDPEPCYFWNTSSGPCSLSKFNRNGDNCGVGVAERTTTCGFPHFLICSYASDMDA